MSYDPSLTEDFTQGEPMHDLVIPACIVQDPVYLDIDENVVDLAVIVARGPTGLHPGCLKKTRL